MQEGGCQVVKLEGGRTMAPTARRLVEIGIPVMGHIGLTPQSVHQLGGHKVQGRTLTAAERLIDDALALEDAGASSIVLESIPAGLAKRITERLTIPTIGIGAGPHCDAQVQVIQDLLGIFTDFVPRHTRHYAELGSLIKDAVQRYAVDVAAGSFPTSKESFSMDQSVLEQLDAHAKVPA
jgi:3-methyl-2-oxobutanoate hydroxymethyltransferase